MAFPLCGVQPGVLLSGLFVFCALGCNACGSTSKQAGAPTVSPSAAAPAPAAPALTAGAGTAPAAERVTGGCAVGGCGGELCVDGSAASEPSFSNCAYQRHFECYKEATCGRDAQNQCNWAESPLLTKCLKRHGAL